VLPRARIALPQAALSVANWLTIGAIVWLLLDRRVEYTTTLAVLQLAAVAELKDYINAMIANLRATTERDTEQDWLKTNIAKFSRMMQGQRDLFTVGQMLLSELAPLVHAHQGVMYVMDVADDESILKPLAGYANRTGPQMPGAFRIGEGLVGQCADRQRILLNDFREETIVIGGGLLQAKPRSVLVLPVRFEGQVKAVIELADGTDGYPGRLEASATFTIEPDALRVELQARVDRSCPVASTLHPYFNLGGAHDRPVFDHLLYVEADELLEVDARLIPTGTRLTVAGTPFDFREEARLGTRLDSAHPQLRLGRGLDHAFVLRPVRERDGECRPRDRPARADDTVHRRRGAGPRRALSEHAIRRGAARDAVRLRVRHRGHGEQPRLRRRADRAQSPAWRDTPAVRQLDTADRLSAAAGCRRTSVGASCEHSAKGHARTIRFEQFFGRRLVHVRLDPPASCAACEDDEITEIHGSRLQAGQLRLEIDTRERVEHRAPVAQTFHVEHVRLDLGPIPAERLREEIRDSRRADRGRTVVCPDHGRGQVERSHPLHVARFVACDETLHELRHFTVQPRVCRIRRRYLRRTWLCRAARHQEREQYRYGASGFRLGH